MNYDTKITNQFEALSKSLAEMLTGSLITRFLDMVGLVDNSQGNETKWKRIHNAFALSFNTEHNLKRILSFVEAVADPVRYNDCELYKEHVKNLNSTLLYMGYEIGLDGKIVISEKATTIDEVEERLSVLTEHVKSRKIHPYVLKYCSREYLVKDYFHATFEAVKGLYDRIRELSHVNADGNSLIEQVFSSKEPKLVINKMTTPSDINEFEGFKHLLLFLHKSVRNVEAHDPRLGNDQGLEWCLDIFTCLSIAERYLDGAQTTCFTPSD